MMVQVTMNCATMFCLRPMYTYNSSIFTSLSASTIRGYYHLPSGRLFRVFPMICCTTWWWNPPKVRDMRRINTQVSNLNSRISCKTATYNRPNVLSLLTHYLQEVGHTFCALWRLATNSVNSLSTANRVRPR